MPEIVMFSPADDGAIGCPAPWKVCTKGVGVDAGLADVSAVLDLGDIRASHQILFSQLRVGVTEDQVRTKSQQVAHWQVEPVEARDLNQIAKAARELPSVGFAEKTSSVLVDRTNSPIGLQSAALAVDPFRMSRHSSGDFFERLATGRAAKVEDRKAVGRGARLKKAILQWLAERVHAVLPLAEVAQPVEKLAMVGGQDHNFVILPSQHGLLQALQWQVALSAVELREILDEDR